MDPSGLPAPASPLLGAPDPQQNVGEHVLVEAEAQPGRQVQQGDQAHHIVGVVGVIPGAGVKLPEEQAPAELPGVDEADVEGQPAAGAPASAEVQVEVELLHHEAAAAVHQEGPQGRVSTQAPVRLLHQAEHGREKHLVQEAVHPKEEEACKAGQGQEPVTVTPLPCRRGVPQPGEPSVEHLGEVQSQGVVHGQLRARHQPHLLGQSVDVADQDLEPDVDGRVEDEVEDRRPSKEAPPLGVDLLQCKVGQRMQDAEVQRGEAHQFLVPMLQQSLERGEQDIQSHAVHPVEVEPHPWRQRPCRVLARWSPARLRGVSAHDQSVSAGSFACCHPTHRSAAAGSVSCTLHTKRLLHSWPLWKTALVCASPGSFPPAKLLSPSARHQTTLCVFEIEQFTCFLHCLPPQKSASTAITVLLKIAHFSFSALLCL